VRGRPTRRARRRAGGPAPRVAAGAAALAVALALTLVGPRGVRAVEETPTQLEGVGVEEHLGDSVDLTLTFTDENGRRVKLGDYFRDDKPVVLTLNYYTCTALCNLHLNALVETLRELDWTPGEEFRVVTVSINPAEDAALARGKRASYLKVLEKGPDAGWHFLTAGDGGDPPRGDAPNDDSPRDASAARDLNVRALARSVGFGYRYDPESQQYAHAAVTMFLSPEGKVARYLYGIGLPPRDVKFGLIEAAEGRVGSTLEKILLTCFHYDEQAGRYGAYAFGIMRLGAIVTLVALGLLLLVLWRRERGRGRGRGGGAPWRTDELARSRH
jgi:protein SCO1/2